jgi:hypothetical protein
MRALHPAWQDYRRRRRWFWSAMALFFVVGFAVAGLTDGHRIEMTTGIVLVFLCFVPALVAQHWLYRFPCPRCRQPFLRPRRSVNPACAHCGFAKWGDPDTFA